MVDNATTRFNYLTFHKYNNCPNHNKIKDVRYFWRGFLDKLQGS